MTLQAPLFRTRKWFVGSPCRAPLISLSLLLSSCGSSGGSSTPGSLSSGGFTRTYRLYVPTSYRQNSSALIIVLHGSGGFGAEMEAGTGLDAKADQIGFAVAYPDAGLAPAVGLTEWNNFFDDGLFSGNPPDDVGFLRDLINTLQVNIHPDAKRIYVTGISNGGGMTYRVGVELSDLVAAIGVVEGTLYGFGGNLQGIPAAVAPVSVLILHGDQDSTIPYCVGPDFGAASQELTFNYWVGASANQCTRFDTTTPLCDGQGNITAIYEKDAANCSGNTEVRFYKLIGGGHTWYTRPMNVRGQVPYNPDFNSSTGVTTDDILWSFFASHPMP